VLDVLHPTFASLSPAFSVLLLLKSGERYSLFILRRANFSESGVPTLFPFGNALSGFIGFTMITSTRRTAAHFG